MSALLSGLNVHHIFKILVLRNVTQFNCLDNNHLKHYSFYVVVVQDELLYVRRLPEQSVGDHRQPVTGEVQPGQPGINEMSRREYGDYHYKSDH